MCLQGRWPGAARGSPGQMARAQRYVGASCSRGIVLLLLILKLSASAVFPAPGRKPGQEWLTQQAVVVLWSLGSPSHLSGQPECG